MNDFNLNIQFFENLKKTVWEVRKLDKENLAFRLGILKEAGVINERIYDKLTLLIKYLDEKWKISLTESNGGMLITHLSMAMKRIEEKQIKIDYEELPNKEVLNKANEAVLVIKKQNQMLRKLTEKIINVEYIGEIQKKVLENKMLPAY